MIAAPANENDIVGSEVEVADNGVEDRCPSWSSNEDGDGDDSADDSIGDACGGGGKF